jgi:predicted lipid-binding transport protein (Tim44 family)
LCQPQKSPDSKTHLKEISEETRMKRLVYASALALLACAAHARAQQQPAQHQQPARQQQSAQQSQPAAQPQSPAAQPTEQSSAASDAEGIRQAALDYAEGYYEGNAERMERALHPDLAKRIVHTNPQNGRSRLDQMSALSLVQVARGGSGRQTPKERQQKDVTVLDVYENAATVKLVMSGWVDYLHVAKFNGRWVIVNVLWALKPQQR